MMCLLRPKATEATAVVVAVAMAEGDAMVVS